MRIKAGVVLTVLLSVVLPLIGAAESLSPSLSSSIARGDSWTDQFGETTYTIAAPDTAGIGDSVRVVLTARDRYYPNDMVAAPWRLLVDGVVEDNGFWISLSDTTWESAYAFVYEFEDAHTFTFEAQDLGHGNGSHSYEWFEIERTTIITESTASASDPVRLGSKVVLLGTTPNPFRSVTTGRYDLPEVMCVNVQVYDLSGRLVRVLVDGAPQQAGRRSVVWDGADDNGVALDSGIYFLRLEAGATSQSRHIVLVK